MRREKAFVFYTQEEAGWSQPRGVEARLRVKEVEMAQTLKCRVGGEDEFSGTGRGLGDMDPDIWSHLASV